MKDAIKAIAWIFLIIGGLNWGLAIFDFNLVTYLLGSLPVLVDIVYGLVGASALYAAYCWIKDAM